MVVDVFLPKPGRFYAHNAAVALGDDARQVAYASGGEVLLRDIRTGRTHGPWKLPRGARIAVSGMERE